MSSRGGAKVRPSLGVGLYRLAPLLVALLLLPALFQGAVRADPPFAVSRLSADEVRAADATVLLVRHPTPPGLLIEAALSAGMAGATLLAVAPDAGGLALGAPHAADGVGLIVARADGSQLRVRMPALQTATYQPAGDGLLAIDEFGALWQVAVDSGKPQQLAEGPFAGRPVIGPDGSILLLSVSSLEAPIDSVAVRLDLGSGDLSPISDAALVYGIFPLLEGAVAVVVHEAGQSTVRRIAAGRERRLADLGSGAVNVAVAPDGTIAFERSGSVFVLTGNGNLPRLLLAGEKPVFSPDGSALLVQTVRGLSLVGLDGTLLERFDGQIGFAACPAGCPS